MSTTPIPWLCAMQNPPRSDKPLFFIQVWPSRKGVAFDMTEADADLACRAVNNHAALLKALDECTDELTQIRLMYNHTENSDPRGQAILQSAVDLYLKLSK